MVTKRLAIKVLNLKGVNVLMLKSVKVLKC